MRKSSMVIVSMVMAQVRTIFIVIVLALLTTLQPVFAVPLSYKITNLFPLRNPWGINDSGQICGTMSPAFDHVPAVWENGTITFADTGTFLDDGKQLSWVVSSDINDDSQVVGHVRIREVSTGTYVERAFLWDPIEGMKDIGTLVGGDEAHATSVNNSGQVVGWSRKPGADPDTGSDSHAFLWENGTMTDLGTLGGRFSWASGINQRGQVVGQAYDVAFRDLAFIWENATMTSLGKLDTYPPSSESQALDINNCGHVVGWSGEGLGFHDAFMWDSTNGIQDLGRLGTGGFRRTTGRAINDSGQVVGTSITNNAIYHAFIWENGVMYDLNDFVSDWELYEATDINNAGQIIGNGSGGYFLLTPCDFPPSPNPIPDPSSILLMGAGLIGLVGFRKKFKV